MQDSQLIQWLREKAVPCLPVYTKIDKLSNNEREKNASLLDAGHGIKSRDRVLFSAKTAQGREELIAALAGFLDS
jgi:GTP-binding protein